MSDAGGGKVSLKGGKDKKYCADEGNKITCNRCAFASHAHLQEV